MESEICKQCVFKEYFSFFESQDEMDVIFSFQQFHNAIWMVLSLYHNNDRNLILPSVCVTRVKVKPEYLGTVGLKPEKVFLKDKKCPYFLEHFLKDGEKEEN